MTIKLYPFRLGLASGNIIWAERNLGDSYYRVSRFGMNGGRFPPTHPVAPGEAKSNNRAETGTSAALDAFRARGYWASCPAHGRDVEAGRANVQGLTRRLR